MLALQGDAEAHGAVVALSTTVDSGVYNAQDRTFVLHATQGGEQHEVPCDYVVNATGIFAPRLLDAITASGTDAHATPNERTARPSVPSAFAKGTYFKLRESSRPFRCERLQ